MRTTRRSSLKSYLVEPFKQIRFGLHVVIVCLFYVILLGFLFGRSFYQQYAQVMEMFQVVDPDAKWDLVLNETFLDNAKLICGALVALVVTMLAVVIRRTHKMYGPMIAVLRFVNELKRGNYAVRMKIREKDDFQSVVSNLNQLAEELHRRHGIAIADNPPKTDLDALSDRVSEYEQGIVTVSNPGQSYEDNESTPKAS